MFRSFARPSAAIPLVMSMGAFALVVAHVALDGAVRQADEGAAAHVFQLLIVAQIPIATFFAIRWFRRSPKDAMRVLLAQAAAIAIALTPVWYFGL